MKNTFYLFLILLFTACQKEEVMPTPEPEPTPAPQPEPPPPTPTYDTSIYILIDSTHLVSTFEFPPVVEETEHTINSQVEVLISTDKKVMHYNGGYFDKHDNFDDRYVRYDKYFCEITLKGDSIFYYYTVGTKTNNTVITAKGYKKK